ncbi:MAG: hypothetical protein C0446_14720 [Chitinophaga sp.]|nr:hypothetical protein [Chitinophaga sp.]
MKMTVLKNHCKSKINQTLDQIMDVGILKLKAIHTDIIWHDSIRFGLTVNCGISLLLVIVMVV